MIASRVGARRAGITVAAECCRQWAIEYRRGQMHIIDRDVLEHTVCECYKLIKSENVLLPLPSEQLDYSAFSL